MNLNMRNIFKLLPILKQKSGLLNTQRLKSCANQNTLVGISATKKNSTAETVQLAETINSDSARYRISINSSTDNEKYGEINSEVIGGGSVVEFAPENPAGVKNYAPTFNLAACVDKSPSLQQLIRLGVDLNKIERRKGLPQFLLKLDFERDIKPYLIFLNDRGVAAEHFGEIITKNPLLFKVDMDDLHARVNYLESKKFHQAQVQRILTINPFWLMFSTVRINRRLGHFQKEFHLTGDDIRFLASKQPRLITYNMDHILKSTFCIREEMGFDEEEVKCLLLGKPRLWMMQTDQIIERFAYAHQQMDLSHEMLTQFPEVLTSRLYRLQQRHEYMELIGRAQYNPKKDLYISPKALVEGSDSYFVKYIAKTDFNTYHKFLLTK